MIVINRKERLMVINSLKRFLKEEDGVGVVEVILILVVLVGLIIIFKAKLTVLMNKIFSTITERADTL